VTKRTGTVNADRSGLIFNPLTGAPGGAPVFQQAGTLMKTTHLNFRQFSIALVSIMISGVIQADNLIVDTVDDAGPGSLRSAIELANLEPDAQTILFDPSVHGGSIVLQSALPTIIGDLEIIGPGAGLLSIDGNQAHQIIAIATGVTAVVSDLTLTQGSNKLGGGAIMNEGDLTMVGSALIGNKAEFGGGGAIDNVQGTLTLINTILANNEANFGGAISNFNGSVLIVNSTLAENAALLGGAIDNSGLLVIEASTLHANQADLGGGIENVGSMDIINSTLSANHALEDGGAIDNFGGSLRLLHVTFADNEAGLDGSAIWTGPDLDDDEVIAKNVIIAGDGENDCYIDEPDSWTTGGNNLTGDSACSGFQVVDLNDLQLEPLGDNGGPTLTHALGEFSLALDAADDCTDFNGLTSVDEDQRGTARPQGDHCDVGAYERIVETEKEDVIFADRFQVFIP
jgi:fibronectin-binding autotransporter adhesin